MLEFIDMACNGNLSQGSPLDSQNVLFSDIPDAANPNDSLMNGIRKLKEEKEVLEGVFSSMEQKQSLATGSLIMCLGVLSQFKVSTVREDFLRGKIVDVFETEQILGSLLKMGDTLLPFPGSKVSAAESATFAAKLLSQNQEEPVVAGKPLAFAQSFSAWRFFLQRVKQSGYWSEVQTNPDDFRSRQTIRLHDTIKRDAQFVDGDSAHFTNRRHSSPAPRTVRASRVKKLKVKQEYRASSDSGSSRSDSDGNSFSSGSSQSSVNFSEGDNRTRRDGRDESVIEILRNFKFSKEIVAPPPFELDSSTSFREFLKSFEKYFSHKFHGNEKEKSRQLGKFLRGRVKEAYNAIGGDNLKYRDLKPSMLEWYDSEKGSSRNRRRVEFDTCGILNGESVSIYCLRLERLARKAFPDARRERERNMYNKARETFPSALVEKIDNAQGLADAFGGSRLNWRNIKKLAENFDRAIREKSSNQRRALSSGEIDAQLYVSEYCSGQKDDVARKWTSYESEGLSRKTRPFERKQYPVSKGNIGKGARAKTENTWSPTCASRVSFNKQTNVCAWCSKQGHTEQKCWRKNNACLLCGSKHHYLKECIENRWARSPDNHARQNEGSSHDGQERVPLKSEEALN